MKITECDKCDNFIKRENIISGIGNVNADIMFLFDHPRYKQDRTGLLRSNDDLNTFLGYLMDAGFDEFNAYYTYLVKCKCVTVHNFNIAMDICSNAHLSREYISNGKHKKILVTVGKKVSNYIFAGKPYKYFHVYDNISDVIPIPEVSHFVKTGVLSARRLKTIKTYYDGYR